MSSSNNHYNKKLKGLARALRKQSTKAEIRLWCELLRNKQMLGFPFLRQRIVGNYIADFISKNLSLAIEADGFSHQWEETYLKDRKKEEFLNDIGITVLRFADNEIMDNVEGVRMVIEDWIRLNHSDKLPGP